MIKIRISNRSLRPYFDVGVTFNLLVIKCSKENYKKKLKWTHEALPVAWSQINFSSSLLNNTFIYKIFSKLRTSRQICLVFLSFYAQFSYKIWN